LYVTLVIYQESLRDAQTIKYKKIKKNLDLMKKKWKTFKKSPTKQMLMRKICW